MQSIVPNVYTFSDLIVGRVYLIVDPDGLSLIDTSIATAAPKILRQIAAMGRSAHDVKRILITHAHPDHIGGLPALKAATGAQVIASAVERPVIEGQIPIPRVTREKAVGLARYGIRPPATTATPTSVDRDVQDGIVLTDVLGGLQVVGTPGHAAGHISFWQPEKRILFSGDVIMRFGTMRRPFSILTCDMQQNDTSIRRVIDLNADVICFGHGKPITQAAPAKLRAFGQRIGVI